MKQFVKTKNKCFGIAIGYCISLIAVISVFVIQSASYAQTLPSIPLLVAPVGEVMGGHQTGNGGNSITCNIDGERQTLVFDRWYAQQHLGVELNSFDDMELMDSIWIALQRLEGLWTTPEVQNKILKIAQNIMTNLDYSLSAGRQLSGEPIYDQFALWRNMLSVYHSYIVMKKQKCELSALGVYYDSIDELWINPHTYNKLAKIDKAMLIVHETMYKFIRNEFHDDIHFDNSELARQLTICAFSKKDRCGAWRQNLNNSQDQANKNLQCSNNNLEYSVYHDSENNAWVMQIQKYKQFKLPFPVLLSIAANDLQFVDQVSNAAEGTIGAMFLGHSPSYTSSFSFFDNNLLFNYFLNFDLAANSSGELLIDISSNNIDEAGASFCKSI